MDQTKESILGRIETAIEQGGEEALKFFHDGVTTIERWLAGDTGSAAQASVDTRPAAVLSTDTPTPPSA